MEIVETLVSAWKLQKKNASIPYFADPKSLPWLHITGTPGRPFVTRPGLEEEINEFFREVTVRTIEHMFVYPNGTYRFEYAESPGNT